MAEVTKTLILGFGRIDEKIFSLSLSDYKETITDAQIKTQMQVILDADFFQSDGMSLVSLAKATRKTVTDTMLIEPDPLAQP